MGLATWWGRIYWPLAPIRMDVDSKDMPMCVRQSIKGSESICLSIFCKDTYARSEETPIELISFGRYDTRHAARQRTSKPNNFLYRCGLYTHD